MGTYDWGVKVSAVKHDPDALLRSMVKGLRECRDSSGAPMAAILLAIANNSSSPMTEEGDAADALMASTVITPILDRMTREAREKLSGDLLASGTILLMLSTAVDMHIRDGVVK